MTRQRGSVSWWCDCPGRKDACQRPTARNHKNWYYAIRVDATDRDDAQVKRGGFTTQTAATAALEHVRELLAVAETDDRVQRRIADVVIERSRRGGTLPSVDEVRAKFGVGLDPVAPSMSVGDWLDEWLASKRRAGTATLDLYKLRVRLLKPHIGEIPLDRLRGSHVAAMLDWVDRRNQVIREARQANVRVPTDPLDARTRQVLIGETAAAQLVGVLSMALRAAIKRRLVSFNAAKEVEFRQPGKSTRARVWDPTQVATFVAGTHDHRLGAAFRVVLLRGLRRGELCGLQWADVDLDNRRVEIKRTMRFARPRKGIVAFGKTKTESSTRVVTIDRGTADALRKLKSRQRQERLAAGAAWRGGETPDQDWVVARPDGFPVPPPLVRTEFKRAARDLGLPVIRFHDGRHTAATLAFEADLNVKLVSEQLGHSSTRITTEIYTHVRLAKHDEAAETIETFVFGANGTVVEQTSANERERR